MRILKLILELARKIFKMDKKKFKPKEISTPPIKCHACAGTVSLGFTTAKEPVMLHSIPMCDDYRKVKSRGTPVDTIKYMQKSSHDMKHDSHPKHP